MKNAKNKQIAELLTQVIGLLNSDDEEEPQPKKRGRPKKDPTINGAGVSVRNVVEEETIEVEKPPTRPKVDDFLAPVRNRPEPPRRIEPEEAEAVVDNEDDESTEKQYARLEPVRLAGVNKFQDDLREARADLQPEEIKEKFVPVTRRPKQKKISIRCTVCGRDDKVYPSEVPGRRLKGDEAPRYRCNRCCSGR